MDLGETAGADIDCELPATADPWVLSRAPNQVMAWRNSYVERSVGPGLKRSHHAGIVCHFKRDV